MTGLPTFICPECGSDLRQVGIQSRERLTPVRRFRKRDLPPALRWKMRWQLIGAVVVILTVQVPLLLLTPTWRTDHRRDNYTPNSKSFASLMIANDFRTLVWTGKRTTTSISVASRRN